MQIVPVLVLAFPVQSPVCAQQMKKPARTLIARRFILIVTLKIVTRTSYIARHLFNHINS